MHSIVEYYAEHEKYKCGYCKRPDTNFSHGMWAHALSVTDYQDLIDRGWRRSGKYCYKPTMDLTCCPMYTIRCRVEEFKLTKSQKKVVKKFNKFISGQETLGQVSNTMKVSTGSGDAAEGEMGRESFVESNKEHQCIDVADVTGMMDEDKQESDDQKVVENNCEIENVPCSSTTNLTQDNALGSSIKKGIGPDPSKGPCKKAKQLRKERKLEKLKLKGVDISNLQLPNNSHSTEKQIEDFINELPAEVKHKLEIRLVRTEPASPEWLATAKISYDIYVKYQVTIHGDKPTKCTESSFKDFLVQSPLLEEYNENGPPCGYGSFHQQYWVDGHMIAVGVIDILPKCVSSVYFFYDPQYTDFTIGTYGALREVSFTRHLHTLSPDLKYYYMGYYIHSCPKMRYKGNFHPSDLLCPETYNWFPLSECVPKLDLSPYSRLDPNLSNTDVNACKESSLNFVPVLLKGAVMLYKIYKRKTKKDDDAELLEYMKLVGCKTATRLILAR